MAGLRREILSLHMEPAVIGKEARLLPLLLLILLNTNTTLIIAIATAGQLLKLGYRTVADLSHVTPQTLAQRKWHVVKR